MKRFIVLAVVSLGLVACGGQDSFTLTSTAFEEGAPIPTRHACDGENLSPALTWTDPPTGTKSFALIMDDPDAPMGTWDHWLLFDLDPALRKLEEAAGNDPDSESFQGTAGGNSWNVLRYGGPCPPGGVHRYFFKFYALDTLLELEPGVDKATLFEAMKDHILAEAQLMGTYEIVE